MENDMRILTTLTLLLALLVVPAAAQDYDDVQGVGVARLSLVNGDVTVQRGDSGELVAGERNAPLVARDHVITGSNSRAEVQFDRVNSIRLDSLGELRIAELRGELSHFLNVIVLRAGVGCALQEFVCVLLAILGPCRLRQLIVAGAEVAIRFGGPSYQRHAHQRTD